LALACIDITGKRWIVDLMLFAVCDAMDNERKHLVVSTLKAVPINEEFI